MMNCDDKDNIWQETEQTKDGALMKWLKQEAPHVPEKRWS